MFRNNLNEDELYILNSTHFTITHSGQKYKNTLEYIPYSLLNNWVGKQLKLTKKTTKVKIWIELAKIYSNLCDLSCINYDLIKHSQYQSILVKAGLINSISYKRSELINLLIEFCSDLDNTDYFTRFVQLSILNQYSQSNDIAIFNGLTNLPLKEKDYFWSLFYYLNTDYEELVALNNTHHKLKLLKLGLESWRLLFKEVDTSYLKSVLDNLFFIDTNESLIKCICENQKFESPITFNSKNNYYEFEEILGIPLNTNYKKAKLMYLTLIKTNHPDLHPNNIDYYTKKTSEINRAWREWNEYNEL